MIPFCFGLKFNISKLVYSSMLGLKTSRCTRGREGGGRGEFNVGEQRTLDICSYHYLFGGTEEK